MQFVRKSILVSRATAAASVNAPSSSAGIINNAAAAALGSNSSCTNHSIIRRFFSDEGRPAAPVESLEPSLGSIISSPSRSTPSPKSTVLQSSREFSTIKPDHMAIIEEHAAKSQTSVSLRTLMETGKGELLHVQPPKAASSHNEVPETAATKLVLKQVAGFLRHELPIRLAHRIKDLDNVPLMKDMPSVLIAKDWYVTSFLELTQFPKGPLSSKQEEEFAALLENIYERHAGVLVTMARGAFELRAAIREKKIGADGLVGFEEMENMHAFLDRFYLSRIGIRMLIGQYLSLRQPPMENYVGMICQETLCSKVVQQAIEDASFMCNRKYGDCPEVILHGNDLSFSYVPTHIHYIMLELIKNSMRATVESHGIDGDFPPIHVIIADGKDNEDVVIKVSDEGGGIPRSNMRKIWSYLFTTADPAVQEGMVAFENIDHSVDSPLAGLGYGLPISRSYARYFGGDLSITSMEGYGTDAFLHLTRLGNVREPLT
jgi:pyruvate dehydrogenase kinase 2/3/4